MRIESPDDSKQAPTRPAARGAVTQLSARTPLAAALGVWESHMLQVGLADNTIKAFSGDLRLLGKFLGMGHPIGEFTTTELNNFLRWLEHDRGVPCSPKSYARRVTSVKAFFKWLAEAGVLAHDPAAAVLQRSVSSPLPDILTPEETEQVLAVAQVLRHGDDDRKPDARPYLLLALVLQTGIKKSEVMAIAPNHIDLSNADSPALYIRYGNPRQRHKERKLKLDPAWPQALAEYRAQYGPRERLFECTARNLEYVLGDVGQLADLHKPLSFEALRWTCAAHDFASGNSPETLRLKLGLSKITWRETEEKLVRLTGVTA
jgi:site-specific recombinase XerD